MKQSLQLNLGQHLTMTPQLQHSIKLLLLSTVEMQQEIQEALESNIMLETEEEYSVDDSQESSDPTPKSESEEPVSSNGSETDIPDELPIDTSWEDIYDNVHNLSTNLNPERQEFDSIGSKDRTLDDFLKEQLALVPFSDRDKTIAMVIIDAIDSDGYLSNTIDELWSELAKQIDELEVEEVKAVLNRIQSFDPLGVAALDLADCLRIQLNQLPETEPLKAVAIELVGKYLDLLVAQEKTALIKKLGITETKLAGVMELIRSLDPKPGMRIDSSHSEYVVPDVFVFWDKNQWRVELNQDISPRLRINPFYQSMINRRDNSDDNSSMKTHLQEAQWFIKSLNSRNDTILRVAKTIVDQQKGFLENGPIAMKPMVLKDVAELVEVHESTVSRVTTQKYMHTPRGIYEFKYFFTSHVATSEGGECSAVAIKAFIKDLISNENSNKPLSDNKIANLLNEKGINIARRTVAKYREAMLIPPSNQRKRII